MYYYFDHPADIGIVGVGSTVEEAFEEAAKAMFNIMVDIDKVKPLKSFELDCKSDNREELLIEWLNTLLTKADLYESVFSEFKVTHLTDTELSGYALGELLDPVRHIAKTEVKAATYSMLFVGRIDNTYQAKCVVDV